MNSLPKTVTRQSRDCDLYQGPSVPKSSTLTARLPSHPVRALFSVRPDNHVLYYTHVKVLYSVVLLDCLGLFLQNCTV